MVLEEGQAQAALPQVTKKYQIVLSGDRILGKKAQVLSATLSRLMAGKMEESISYVEGWVNGQITIAFARS